MSLAGQDLDAGNGPQQVSGGAGAVDLSAETVVGQKLAAQVARRIEASIIEAGWPVGAVLGSELELRERYGVSRSIMREAVRLTEHHQVARTRRGPGGGLVVSAPDARSALHAVVVYLEYVGLSVEDVLQARLLLEPIAAAAAAARMSEEDIADLRRQLAEEVERRAEPGLDAQDRLHVMLARISGNPVLELFVDVLTRLTANQAYTTRRLTKAEIHEAKIDSHDRHESIVRAVIAGEGNRAAAETADHLRETADWLRQRERTRRPGVRRAPEPEPGTKLAETVASRLLAEIERRGWPVGMVLGSEADLLARYGVSRSALREGVRILEYHSIARMRRGPGGGLVVAEPEPDASIDAMALYLDYRGVGSDDLLEVRHAIELGALGEVMARHDDPEVAAVLRNAIERSAEPSAPERPTGADLFHSELVQLAGNPVLTLFLRVLTELWTRHAPNTPGPQPGPEAVATVEKVHGRILDAVLEGDTDLARHRMRRHLDALKAWYH